MSMGLRPKCQRITSAGNFIYTINSNFENLQKRDRLKCSTANWVNHTDSSLRCSIAQSTQRNLWTVPDIDTRRLEHLPQNTQNLPPEDVQARGDFTVYPGGELNKFFSNAVPLRVSEVCLMNDHYILVKMPEPCWRQTLVVQEETQEESQQQDQENTIVAYDDRLHEVNAFQQTPPAGNGELRRQPAKFFRCNRSRRISPIDEQIELEVEANLEQQLDAVPTTKSKKVPNSPIIEVYETITKITTRPKPCPVKAVDIDAANSLTEPQQLLAKRVRITEEPVVRRHAPEIPSTSTTSDIFRKSNALPLNASSLRDHVMLEQHGALLTPPTRSFGTANIADLHRQGAANKSSGGEIVENVDRNKKASTTKSLHHGFNAFRWLLRTVLKRRSTRKPKSKIHGVIYKTYFVRWKKSTPTSMEDGYLHGFGVQPQPWTERKLKRSRSATF